ncbi:MAG: RnfH family protein [Xanthomonadales bacterium]|nr:RnfH family protein [Xanthomonadales bacterium]
MSPEEVNEGPAAHLEVEVVYGDPQHQTLRQLRLAAGATVADAIAAAELERDWPELELDPDAVGVWGRKVSLGQALKSGDRVEVYRPLLADPKEVRRARAEAARTQDD